MSAPELLRAPAENLREDTEIGRYLGWLAQHRGLDFRDYAGLHAWSVQDLGAFWSSVWEFSGVQAHTPPAAALGRRDMPGAEWFPGATLNYAEHALRRADGAPADVAVLGYSQTREPVRLTWAELADRVARARAGLARLGVGRGDRVVA